MDCSCSCRLGSGFPVLLVYAACVGMREGFGWRLLCWDCNGLAQVGVPCSAFEHFECDIVCLLCKVRQVKNATAVWHLPRFQLRALTRQF